MPPWERGAAQRGVQLRELPLQRCVWSPRARNGSPWKPSVCSLPRRPAFPQETGLPLRQSRCTCCFSRSCLWGGFSGSALPWQSPVHSLSTSQCPRCYGVPTSCVISPLHLLAFCLVQRNPYPGTAHVAEAFWFVCLFAFVHLVACPC